MIHLDLSNVDPTWIEDLVRKSKPPGKLHIITWTADRLAVLVLNNYLRQGHDVRLITAQDLIGAKFPYRVRKNCHAKVALVGKRVYVGSANLVADTIANLTVEVKDNAQKTKVSAFFQSVWDDNYTPENKVV